MSAQPEISVIVACYNGHPWLGHVIACLRRQTVDDIEIVLAPDDGKDYSLFATLDPRIRLLPATQGLGIDMNRNRALAQCRGRWTFPLDHDDVLPQRFLEAMLLAALGHDADASVAPTAYVEAALACGAQAIEDVARDVVRGETRSADNVVRIVRPAGRLCRVMDMTRSLGSLHVLARRHCEVGWVGRFAQDVWRDGSIIARNGPLPVATTCYVQTLHPQSMLATAHERYIRDEYRAYVRRLAAPAPNDPQGCSLNSAQRAQMIQLFEYRLFASAAYSRYRRHHSGSYHAFAAGNEEALWHAFAQRQARSCLDCLDLVGSSRAGLDGGAAAGVTVAAKNGRRVANADGEDVGVQDPADAGSIAADAVRGAEGQAC